MMALLNFTLLTLATLFAVAAAAALHWLGLHVAMVLMPLARARQLAARSELARGTAHLGRALASDR